MKRIWIIVIAFAAVLLAGGGSFAGYLYLDENYFTPLQDAEDLNAAYLEAYGDIGSVVIGWVATNTQSCGRQIEQRDLAAVMLPAGAVEGGIATDLSALVGKYYRIDITPGSLLSMDMVMDFPQSPDDRAFDVITAYNPIGLRVGDLVDIRVNLPNGEDYVAISCKRVEGIYNDVLKLVMSEYDIAVYNSLMVDAALFKGAVIYTTQYLSGAQTAAEEFYPISEDVLRVALKNPNIPDWIDYESNRKRRGELEATMAALSENEILSDRLQGGKSAIPGKIQSGQAAWQMEQDLAAARKLEEQLYGGNG